MEDKLNICVFPESLVKTATDSISGTFYVKLGEFVFPDDKWNDFIVIILDWWLNDLLLIITNPIHKITCNFMDGSFRFEISPKIDGFCEINFFSNNSFISNGIINKLVLINDMLSVSNTVLRACKKNGWSTTDIEKLKDSYRRLQIARKLN